MSLVSRRRLGCVSVTIDIVVLIRGFRLGSGVFCGAGFHDDLCSNLSLLSRASREECTRAGMIVMYVLVRTDSECATYINTATGTPIETSSLLARTSGNSYRLANWSSGLSCLKALLSFP